MKIALIRQRFVPHGGAELYLNAVATELVRRGHQVHIYASAWDRSAVPASVQLHPVPIVRTFSFTRALTFALSCRGRLAREKFDVVVSFERTLHQDVYRAGDGCHREYLTQRLLHSSWLKRATIWLNPLHATMLWLERRLFSRSSTRLVIANSVQRKEEIVRHYRFPSDRIHVVHNGVDLTRFQPVPRVKSKNDFVLLFVGSGWRRKGLAHCVQALALLPSYLRLHVFGKGSPKPYLRLARRLGVSDRVTFSPPLRKVEDAYACGDVLLLPAIYEPFSNVCLEAMACGLPVVTSRINGASELILSGQNGAVIDKPNNVPMLAACIRGFLDPERWRDASRRARQTAELFPLTANVEKMLELIGSLQR